jgi:FkbM family methyltransferase
MKIFLDVGAHVGQTLKAVRDLPFDRIHCFEPVPQHWPILNKLALGYPAIIEKFGLWGSNAKVRLYDPGSMGASLWQREGRGTHYTTCQMRDATDWFAANIADHDEVYMKLNCEGAELDVLDNLIDNNCLPAHTLVMFDAHKIPELHGHLAAVRERLKSYPSVLSSKEIPPGATHEARIRSWLTMVGFS